MIRNLGSLIIRFSGTVIQFISGILVSRFSPDNPEVTAYYFLIVSLIWICIYGISFGFPNHIFIRTSEHNNDINLFSSLNQYIQSYSKLLVYTLPLFVAAIFFVNHYYEIELYSIILIFIAAFFMANNRFCSESLKGYGLENIGIFLDRTFFPFLILIQIILLHKQENLTIENINLCFFFAACISFLTSYIFSFLYLKKNGIKENYKLDFKHLSGQYLIELGEVLSNRLPIILLNIIFVSNSNLIAGISICFTLVSISGTINFALYPYFGREYVRSLKRGNISLAKKTMIYSQLLSGFIYTFYFILLFILGEYILKVYNPDYVKYYPYLVFYSSIMIINQFFGISDYLMSLIRKDSYAILFKVASIIMLFLVAFIANRLDSVHWFLFAGFLSIFVKNLLSYIFHLKYTIND